VPRRAENIGTPGRNCQHAEQNFSACLAEFVGLQD